MTERNNIKPGSLLVRKRRKGDAPFRILSRDLCTSALVVGYDPQTGAIDVLTSEGRRVKDVSVGWWLHDFEVAP